jgi:hypothetical protein
MNETTSPKPKRQFGCGQVIIIMLLTGLVSAGGMFWWAKRYFYAKELAPVALSTEETQQLDRKLQRLEKAAMGGDFPEAPSEGQVLDNADQDPNAEAYSEVGANREIELSERELNALIAKNDPDAAKHFAVDLSKDLVSLKVIVPVDDDAPIVGGRTIRIKMGVGAKYDAGKLQLVLRGISLGGIPMPSAWLGDLKGKDFIQEFGENGGFWKQFSDGIEHLEVLNGRIKVKLLG